ncbi:MAG: hypothetical protein P4L51_03645 [Puia sp.]|nr:hypothetical protein [Puia sp.]
MKKHLLIALMAVATCCIGLSCMAQSSDKETPYLNKSLSAEAITTVEAETSGGSIEVTGGRGQDARIEVYVFPSGINGIFGKLSAAEISKRLSEDYDLSVTVTDHKLVAIARSKNGSEDWKKQLSIAYKIFVPTQVSAHVSTSGGSIHISNLSGREDFSTSGGSLHVSRLSGRITGSTSGGSIHVYDSKDTVDLSTSGGSIHAARCRGWIKLRTSGGSLHLDSLEGSVTATTSGGSIHGGSIAGELHTGTSGGNVSLSHISGSLDASTSGGRIEVEMVAVGKFIRLNNSGGRIDLQVPKDKGFDLQLSGTKIKTDGMTAFSGSADENSMHGSVNGGGIPISVDAGGGKISLSFR